MMKAERGKLMICFLLDSILGEYLIQSVYVCVSHDSCPMIDLHCKWTEQAPIGWEIENTHISIIRKRHNDSFHEKKLKLCKNNVQKQTYRQGKQFVFIMSSTKGSNRVKLDRIEQLSCFCVYLNYIDVMW